LSGIYHSNGGKSTDYNIWRIRKTSEDDEGIYLLFLLFFIAFDLQKKRRNNTDGERAGGKPQQHCSHEKPFWSQWTLYVSIES